MDRTLQDRPRVAVVVAAHNAEATLSRTLASLTQNREPHDVLIVDDCSATPVKATLAPLPRNIKIIRLDTNMGVAAARNYALRYALEEGYDYVAILDADDCALPDRLARQVAYLDSYPTTMLVATWANLLDPNGQKIVESRPPVGAMALRQALRVRNTLIHSSVMFRTTLLRKIGLYDETFDTSQDYEFFCRIAERYEIAVIPELLTNYYILTSSVSGRRRRRMAWNSLRVRIRYFSPRDPRAYWGVLRILPIAMIPRNGALALRRVVDAWS